MRTYKIIDEYPDPSEKMRNELTRHIGTSHWLKDAMATMKERDIIDALSDAQTLLIFLYKRLGEWAEYNRRRE